MGLPVSKGPLSFDCRSDVWRSVPQGTEESQQEVSVPRTPKACGLMIAGHGHLERSILRRKVGANGIVLPPQRAYHLAHNRVFHPTQESDTSAVYERHGERHERSKQSCAKVLRPAAARLSCTAPAVTRSTSPSTIDDVGRVEGHALPTLAELLNPQQQQPPDEVVQSHSDASGNVETAATSAANANAVPLSPAGRLRGIMHVRPQLVGCDLSSCSVQRLVWSLPRTTR